MEGLDGFWREIPHADEEGEEREEHSFPSDASCSVISANKVWAMAAEGGGGKETIIVRDPRYYSCLSFPSLWHARLKKRKRKFSNL